MNDTPIMGTVSFGPELTPDERIARGRDELERLGYSVMPFDASDFAKEWPGKFLDRFDQPMSFRDFLRLKKEVLEAYQEYLKETKYGSINLVPWPEALKALTREDIEILKL